MADKENREVRDGDDCDGLPTGMPDGRDSVRQHQRPCQPCLESGRRRSATIQVLADLNFRPRTTYTAGVINPNPEMELA